MGKDSAALIELGRSFHQVGTVNEKVSESDCGEGGVGRRNALRGERVLRRAVKRLASE